MGKGEKRWRGQSCWLLPVLLVINTEILAGEILVEDIPTD